MKRLDYIDEAKGIGILLIVLGHISTSWGWVSDWAGYFKISIFFVISGYLQSIIKKDINIAQKAKSLLIPYFFYSAICIVFSLILCLLKHESLDSVFVRLINTITFRGISTLWFLPSLFIAILLHKLLHKADLKVRLILIVIVSLAFIIYSEVFMIAIDKSDFFGYFVFCAELTLLKGLVAYCFYEVSFILLSKVLDNKHRDIVLIFAIMTFLICSCAAILLKDTSIDFNNFKFGKYPILFWVFGLIISFDIVVLLKNTAFQSKALGWIGKNSLFIMCTHLIFFIVPIAHKVIGNILFKGEYSNRVEYVIFVSINLFIVLLIESFMIMIWNKMKQIFTKYKATAFCKYL